MNNKNIIFEKIDAIGDLSVNKKAINPFIFRFYLNKENFKFTFLLWEPYNKSKVEWKNFLFAMKNNGNALLDFSNRNHFISIYTNNGNTIFCVESCARGDGDDGKIEIEFSNKNCIEAFENACKSLTPVYFNQKSDISFQFHNFINNLKDLF